MLNIVNSWHTISTPSHQPVVETVR